MTLTLLLVLVVGASLAYANGANDVSKGIATLVGSGVTDYRRAIAWGSVWTGAGGFLGALFAGAMLATFGTGLLTPGTTPSLIGALAALAGAVGCVFLATQTGLPVSTTHAIVGSLVGVAVVAYGAHAVVWYALGHKVFLPLLLSPVASLAATALILRTGRRSRPAGEEPAADCLCAEVELDVVAKGLPAAAAAALAPATPRIEIASGAAEECAAERPQALRLTLGHLHWLTSGAVSLARGMNDAPKIVALALAASTLGVGVAARPPVFYAVVTLAMVTGSLLAGRRVTHVLAEEVTPMDDWEGFTANLVTAALVMTGAVYGLPMSTTHVASGGIFGAGAQRRSLDTRSLRNIVLAWIVTLPVAALLGATSYALGVAMLR